VIQKKKEIRDLDRLKEREGILLIKSSSNDRHKKDKKKHSHKERSKYNRWLLFIKIFYYHF